MQYPNSLAAITIKQKYFKNASFLETSVDHQPSYLWHSVLLPSSQSKRANVGYKVMVVLSKCGKTNGSPPSRLTWFNLLLPCYPPYSTVQSLMDANLSLWNQVLINKIFFPNEAIIILQIPISHIGALDHLIQLHTKKQIFHSPIDRLL